jgi:hypothetical protein
MSRFPIDDSTVDRLLSGRLAPEDAPAGFAGLAELVRIAAGPADPSELVHQASVVAAGIAAMSSAPTNPSVVARRPSMLAKLLSAKVAAIATVAVLGAGTAAAALSGSLPTQTSHASPHAQAGLTTAASHSLATGTSSHPAAGTTSATPGTGTGPVNGIKNGKATFGLCNALLAGPTPNPGKDASTAFKTLIAAHGGSVAATTTFCQSYVKTNHPGQPATTGKPATTGQPATPGKPSGTPGRSSTAGKPSSASPSSGHAPVVTPHR